MALYRAQAILPYFTNLPKDVVVNQFHFRNDVDDAETAADDIQTLLRLFYESVYGIAGTNRVTYINWPLAKIKVFDLADPTPRVPMMRTFNFGSAGTNAAMCPTEVACVLSFHAAPESGTPFQRLYNRIFLGGISHGFIQASSGSSYPVFTSGWITLVTNGALNLADGEGNTSWRQVSEATGLIAARPVVGGWVDNSPDTQRRRSVVSTLRNTWTV